MIGNNNNDIVNRMHHDKYLQSREKEKKKVVNKHHQHQQQRQHHENNHKNNTPEQLKTNLKNRLNIDASDIFNTLYNINENDISNSSINNIKHTSYCNYSYINILKLTYIELTCLRTTIKSIDKKTTLPSPIKSINQDGNAQFPYPTYVQDKRYKVKEDSLYNRHLIAKDQQRNQRSFAKDRKKFEKDHIETLKEWNGLETVSMVKRLFTRGRLSNFHRTAESQITTIINMNTQYEMKCKTYDFDSEHDQALFRSEIREELILLEKLADLEPIVGLSLEHEDKIRSRDFATISNAMLRIRSFIKKTLVNYKNRKALELFVKNSLYEKRDTAARKIQGGVHSFIMRCRLDRIKIHHSIQKIQKKWKEYRYNINLSKELTKWRMENRKNFSALVLQSFIYPRMNWTRSFPILDKFKENYQLFVDVGDEQEFNFADAAVIAVDVVHRQKTISTTNDADLVTVKATKINADLLLMEAKYLFEEGTRIALYEGNYKSGCRKLEVASDIMMDVFQAVDNPLVIKVKEVYATTFLYMGNFDRAGLLFEELLDLLEPIIHDKSQESLADHKKYIHVLQSLAETKVHQLLMNESADILIKLKQYLDTIQKEVSGKRNIYIDKHFEIRENQIIGKLNLLKGLNDDARSNYQKIIDIANTELAEYGDYYDDEKSSMSPQQLHASYLVDAYDNLVEISLIFYQLDEAKTLISHSLSMKMKYFSTNHPTFGYSGYLEAKLNYLKGFFKNSYEMIKEVILKETSKFDDNSTIFAKYIYLQADLEVVLGIHLDEALSKYNSNVSDTNLGSSLLGKAKILELRGYYSEAATVMQEVMSMKEKVLSDEVTMHYEVEELKVLLAKLFCRIGLYKDSKGLLKNTGENLCRIFGNENNIYFANSLISFADLCKLKAKFDVANSLYKQALEIKINTLGDNHLHVAEIYSFMSENMRLCGNLEYADVYCQSALKITYEAIGDMNIRYVLLHLLRGRILCDGGNFSSAEIVLRQCKQEIEESSLGNDNLFYAYCSGILGDCLRLQGKFTASAAILSDSLALFKKSFGSYHHLQGEVLLFNAMLMMDIGQIEEAEVHLMFKILGKVESVLTAAHPLTIFVYGNIDLCKSKIPIATSDTLCISPMQSITSIESTIPAALDIDTITSDTASNSHLKRQKSFITRNSISYSIKDVVNNIPTSKCITTLKKRKDLCYDDKHPFVIRLSGNFPTKNKEEADEEERQEEERREKERKEEKRKKRL